MISLSFCTVTANRLWQLRQTLPENLAAIEQHKDVELVLVNFGSTDGVDDWIAHQFSPFIERSILKYLSIPPCPYHCPKAKNVSHLLGQNEVLFNLDADNFIGDSILQLRTIFTDFHDGIFVHQVDPANNSTVGRISMKKGDFLVLGGYDEEFLPVAYQDIDLVDRAEAFGLIKYLPCEFPFKAPIENSRQEKIVNTGINRKFRYFNASNRRKSIANLATGRVRANPHGWGQAEGILNFRHHICFDPDHNIRPIL